jgi:hypothetical protein
LAVILAGEGFIRPRISEAGERLTPAGTLHSLKARVF